MGPILWNKIRKPLILRLLTICSVEYSSFRETSLIYANYYGTHISAILIHHRHNNIDIGGIIRCLLFGGIIRWLLFGGIIWWYYLVVLFGGIIWWLLFGGIICVCGVVTVLREIQHGHMQNVYLWIIEKDTLRRSLKWIVLIHMTWRRLLNNLNVLKLWTRTITFWVVLSRKLERRFLITYVYLLVGSVIPKSWVKSLQLHGL